MRYVSSHQLQHRYNYAFKHLLCGVSVQVCNVGEPSYISTMKCQHYFIVQTIASQDMRCMLVCFESTMWFVHVQTMQFLLQ